MMDNSTEETQTQTRSSTCPRVLTAEEAEKIAKENPISAFKQQKLEREALKNWDLFYKRNGTKFFKDRHWTSREFYELSGKCDPMNSRDCDKEEKKVLEVGCGVGNAIFPLLQENPNLFVYACDFSPRAIQFIKENPTYDPARCKAFQCDVTADELHEHIPRATIDIVTVLFVLSAILPSNMARVLSNIFKVLKPGGLVLFRDYGLYDHAMLRFSRGHRLAENLYVRQDGTRSFFFSTEFTSQLFESSGFKVVTNEYIKRSTVNKKEGIEVPRIFLQGKFQKPPELLDD